MPVIVAPGSMVLGNFGHRTPGIGVGNLSTAQVTSAASDNIVDRGGSVGPVLLRLTTTVGATPTCTYAIEGSPDGVNFFPVQYADSASPQTLVITTFVITSAVTVFKLIPALIPVRFLRVTYSANTNVTNTLDAFVY
jgi:multisubunit Na+/H+ antiporter MnhC subunit